MPNCCGWPCEGTATCPAAAGQVGGSGYLSSQTFSMRRLLYWLFMLGT
jgi:hypothetical protein